HDRGPPQDHRLSRPSNQCISQGRLGGRHPGPVALWPAPRASCGDPAGLPQCGLSPVAGEAVLQTTPDPPLAPAAHDALVAADGRWNAARLTCHSERATISFMISLVPA